MFVIKFGITSFHFIGLSYYTKNKKIIKGREEIISKVGAGMRTIPKH